jgi:hypothetical protein
MVIRRHRASWVGGVASGGDTSVSPGSGFHLRRSGHLRSLSPAVVRRMNGPPFRTSCESHTSGRVHCVTSSPRHRRYDQLCRLSLPLSSLVRPLVCVRVPLRGVADLAQMEQRIATVAVVCPIRRGQMILAIKPRPRCPRHGAVRPAVVRRDDDQAGLVLTGTCRHHRPTHRASGRDTPIGIYCGICGRR